MAHALLKKRRNHLFLKKRYPNHKKKIFSSIIQMKTRKLSDLAGFFVCALWIFSHPSFHNFFISYGADDNKLLF